MNGSAQVPADPRSAHFFRRFLTKCRKSAPGLLALDVVVGLTISGRWLMASAVASRAIRWRSESPPTAVRLVPVADEVVSAGVRYSGVVKELQKAEVSFRVPGDGGVPPQVRGARRQDAEHPRGRPAQGRRGRRPARPEGLSPRPRRRRGADGDGAGEDGPARSPTPSWPTSSTAAPRTWSARPPAARRTWTPPGPSSATPPPPSWPRAARSRRPRLRSRRRTRTSTTAP